MLDQVLNLAVQYFTLVVRASGEERALEKMQVCDGEHWLLGHEFILA